MGQDLRTEPSQRADEAARHVIGAAIEVHRVMGAGLLESTYEKALVRELTIQQIPHKRQVPIALHYKDAVVGEYVIDLVVAGVLVVELKSVSSISDVHVAQTLAYLTATKLELGLILNFGQPTLRSGIRRVVKTDHSRR